MGSEFNHTDFFGNFGAFSKFSSNEWALSSEQDSESTEAHQKSVE